MIYQPLFDRLLVREIKQKGEKKTKSGIILEKSIIAQSHTHAEVVSVGERVQAVKPGDKIVFTSGIGNPIMVGDEELLLLREEQLDIVQK